MVWRPPQKGNNNPGSDKMKSGKEKPRHGQGGGASKKNSGGIPKNKRSGDLSMTNNIKRNANKQPTIKSLREQRSERYHERVKANRDKERTTKARNKLNRIQNKLYKARAATEAQLKASALLGNKKLQKRYQLEYTRQTKDIRDNGAKLSGLTRRINNLEKIVVEKEREREALLQQIKAIQSARKQKRVSKTSRKTARDSGGVDSTTRNTTAPDSDRIPHDITPADSDIERAQEPFPSETKIGGAIIRDDTRVSPHTYSDTGVSHDSKAYIAAGIAFPQVIEHAPPTPFHETIYQQNLADMFQKAEDSGLTYNHNGVELSITDAIMQGANPHLVWHHIRDYFDGGSGIEKIPYKGIVNLA